MSILVLHIVYLRKIIHLGSFKGIEKIKKLKKAKSRYSNNGISKPVAKDFKEKLDNIMNSEHLYLNPNLKLENLAKRLNVSKNQMSFIINNEFQMDFNSYVNNLRIEHAEEILKNSKNVQITDVMYEVGFNNPTTFNRAFKKRTGVTPTRFTKQPN